MYLLKYRVLFVVSNWDLQLVEKSHTLERPVRYQTGPKTFASMCLGVARLLSSAVDAVVAAWLSIQLPPSDG